MDLKLDEGELGRLSNLESYSREWIEVFSCCALSTKIR